MNDHFFLNICIICPGELAAEREAAEVALSELRLDGNRFRATPFLPDDPLEKRFEEIELSDGIMVLVGAPSGTVTNESVYSISQEYLRAVKMKKYIAAFLIDAPANDPIQQRLIAEMDPHHFGDSGPIQTTHGLETQVKRAIASEFSRCFRQSNDPSRHDLFNMDVDRADKAISENPESDTAWQAAARAYVAVQGTSDARELDFWNRFTGKFTDNGDGWAQLGFLYLRMYGQDATFHEKTLNALIAAIKNGFHDDGLIYDRIGHLHMDKRAPLEAEKYFYEAAQKTPSRFGCCYGGCLMALKKYDQALPLIREAAEKYQRDSRSYFQAGVCYAELNDPESAIEAYKKSIDLDPSYPNAWFNLGGLYWNHDRVDDAKKIWAVCLEKFPDNRMCEPVRYFLSNV